MVLLGFLVSLTAGLATSLRAISSGSHLNALLDLCMVGCKKLC